MDLKTPNRIKGLTNPSAALPEDYQKLLKKMWYMQMQLSKTTL
jgi:hypothetical protein